MNNLMPHTTTVTQLQRNFKKVDKKAKKVQQPVVILSNNKPVGVFVNYKTFRENYELKTARNKSLKSDFSEFLGLWSKSEAAEFDKIIQEEFENIDPGDWK